MSPEICSVEVLRSEFAVFMRGLHFAMVDALGRQVQGTGSWFDGNVGRLGGVGLTETFQRSLDHGRRPFGL
jgi:hypothetical protein